MAVTIKDIAKVCNVSYSTVSRVLNSKFVKSTERNDKILATARALGYKPNQSAIQLVKNTTNMIGLLIPDVANPHYSEITKHVEDAALTNGYQVFLCNTDWDVNKEARYRDALIERRLAGIIVMPVCDESHVIFRGLDIPVVLLGSRTEEKELHYVVMDNVRAAFEATEYLIGMGHRRLAYISRKVANFTSEDRAKGFRLAAGKNGVPAKDAVIAASDSYRLEGGYRTTARLLEGDNPPTAILAFSDFVAIGAMQAAEERGLTPGKDIAILGFDNILFSTLPKINLTTITPSYAEQARKAMDIILSNATSGAKHSRSIEILEPKMVVRGTCCANK